MLATLNPAESKTVLTQQILTYAQERGADVSISKARAIAEKVRRGLFSPDLARVLQYADPVGEEAVNNVLREMQAA